MPNVQYIVIVDKADGNAEVGISWQETRIFSQNATLADVMEWAQADPDKPSRERITITRPHGGGNEF